MLIRNYLFHSFAFCTTMEYSTGSLVEYSTVSLITHLQNIPRLRLKRICGIFHIEIFHGCVICASVEYSRILFDIRHSTLRQAGQAKPGRLPNRPGGEGRTPLSPELIPVAALAAPFLHTPELDPAVQPVLRAPPGLLRLI